MPQTMHTITPLITSQLNHKLNFYKRKQGKPGVKKKKDSGKTILFSLCFSLCLSNHSLHKETELCIFQFKNGPKSFFLLLPLNLSVSFSLPYSFCHSFSVTLSLYSLFSFFSHFLSLLLQSPLPSDPHDWKFRPSQSNWTFRSYHWGGSHQSASWTDSDDRHHLHPPLLPLDQPSVVPLRDAAKHVWHRLDALPYDFAKEKNKKLSLEIQNNHYQFFLFCQLLLFPSPTPQSKLHRSILVIFSLI